MNNIFKILKPKSEYDIIKDIKSLSCKEKYLALLRYNYLSGKFFSKKCILDFTNQFIKDNHELIKYSYKSDIFPLTNPNSYITVFITCIILTLTFKNYITEIEQQIYLRIYIDYNAKIFIEFL